MSPRLRRQAAWALVALDVLVFSGWIATEAVARSSGTEVRLPVGGYDPRDLLSGHYVRFRLEAEDEAARLAGETLATTFCVEERGGRHHVVSVRQEPGGCPLYLRRRGDGFPLFGVDRFFIDERRSAENATVTAGPDTYLRARIDAKGGLHAVDLIVGGKSLSGESGGQ